MRNAGFTIIELLVILGVIAVLLLMAIPSYQHKLVRDQIVEALPLADIAKKPVAQAWQTSAELPADNAAASLPPQEKVVSNYVSGLEVEAGAIHLRFGNRANGQIKGKVISLRPAVVEDAPVVPVAWVCGYAPVPENMTVKGENRTDVSSEYLPYMCRAD
jgi:type IV pilus assembly protein PilA